MKSKALIPLIAGLCVGGLALKIGFNTLRKAQGAPTATVQVWAAKEEIARGVEIDETMLTQIAFPTKLVPPGAITDKKGLVGRVPRLAAPAGLPILEAMLLPPGSKAGLWVKPGFRAVAVKIDESSGVDNHLQPGCHVDVVGYFTIRQNGQQETIARTLIENVEVAAVGARIAAESAEDKNAKNNSSGTKTQPARAVTLLVKPEQVPGLHLAEQRGKIKLSMRGEEDESRLEKMTTVAEQDVVGVMRDVAKTELDPEKYKHGILDQVAQMFEKHDKEMEAKLEHLKAENAKPAPGAPAPVDPKWVMTVWNGSHKKVLGWNGIDSNQSFEIMSAREKEKNARPDQPKPPAKNSRPETREPSPADPADASHAPEADVSQAPENPASTVPVEPEPEPEPDPEPEERSK